MAVSNSSAGFAVKNLIAAVREVLDMDLDHPTERGAALDMLTHALDLIDDGDPPTEVDDDSVDVPHVRT